MKKGVPTVSFAPTSVEYVISNVRTHLQQPNCSHDDKFQIALDVLWVLVYTPSGAGFLLCLTPAVTLCTLSFSIRSSGRVIVGLRFPRFSYFYALKIQQIRFSRTASARKQYDNDIYNKYKRFICPSILFGARSSSGAAPWFLSLVHLDMLLVFC